MRGIADGADQPSATGAVVVDREVVHERTEHVAAEAAPEHDLVGVYVGHDVPSPLTG